MVDYKQGDKNYAIPLGIYEGVTKTLGRKGCLITCMANVLENEGYTINNEAVNPLNLFKYLYHKRGSGLFTPESFEVAPRILFGALGFSHQ